MKKEFSFYEFAGVLMPSVILLFFSSSLLKDEEAYTLFDFDNLGEALIFLTIAYGVGQILHSLGNLFENLLWRIIGGRPTNWLNKKPRFGLELFEEEKITMLQVKIQQDFQSQLKSDYSSLLYPRIVAKGLQERVDIFNANYSMFRALFVSHMLLGLLGVWFQNWYYIIIAFFFAILSLGRMIRFGKYYAQEIYNIYLSID